MQQRYVLSSVVHVLIELVREGVLNDLLCDLFLICQTYV